jgi:hypothetical protein
MNKALISLSIALTFPLFAGCGGAKPYEIVPVEGTITLEGQPIDKIAIRFIPVDQGPESTALSDAQGHFVLKTAEEDPKDGAVVGQHKVLLTDSSIYTKPFRGRASEEEDLTEGKMPRISIRHRVLHGSPLEVSVTAGDSNIELKAEPFDGMGALSPDKLNQAKAADAAAATPAATPAEPAKAAGDDR